jgi:hypothetical protein
MEVPGTIQGLTSTVRAANKGQIKSSSMTDQNTTGQKELRPWIVMVGVGCEDEGNEDRSGCW